MKPKRWWIKKRNNPQTGVYYVAKGQISVTAAKRIEKDTLYGSDVMLPFDTEADYKAKLAELKESGESIL